MSVESRLSKLSSDENVYIKATSVYREELKRAEYNHNLSYNNSDKYNSNSNNNKDNCNNKNDNNYNNNKFKFNHNDNWDNNDNKKDNFSSYENKDSNDNNNNKFKFYSNNNRGNNSNNKNRDENSSDLNLISVFFFSGKIKILFFALQAKNAVSEGEGGHQMIALPALLNDNLS